MKTYTRCQDTARRWQLWRLCPSGRPKACMGDCGWPVRSPHRYSTVGAPRGGWIAAADSLQGADETAQHCYSHLAIFLSDKAEVSLYSKLPVNPLYDRQSGLLAEGERGCTPMECCHWVNVPDWGTAPPSLPSTLLRLGAGAGAKSGQAQGDSAMQYSERGRAPTHPSLHELEHRSDFLQSACCRQAELGTAYAIRCVMQLPK